MRNLNPARRGPMALLCIFVIAATATPANAHPHVWVSVESQIMRGDDGAFTGLRHRWTFDELYSAFAAEGLDKDGDGTFSREELTELTRINIESLAEFDYFTFVQSNGEKLALTAPTDYFLESVGDRLVLNFTLPFSNSVTTSDEAFAYQVYDPSFYIAFEFAEKTAAMLVSSAPGNCAPDLREPTEDDNAQGYTMSEADYAAMEGPGQFGANWASTVHVVCRG